MTREEAIIYFKQCNSRIVSVCKDENEYDYEKQEIISDCARETYEANRLALEALEQETVSREVYEHEYFLRKEFELKIYKLQRQLEEQALNQEPCEDCVNRKAVINIIDELSVYIHNCNAYRLIRGINALPSVQPARTKAKWLNNNNRGTAFNPSWDKYVCSNCGHYSDLENYCANCGASIEDEE